MAQVTVLLAARSWRSASGHFGGRDGELLPIGAGRLGEAFFISFEMDYTQVGDIHEKALEDRTNCANRNKYGCLCK